MVNLLLLLKDRSSMCTNTKNETEKGSLNDAGGGTERPS